MSTSAPDTPPNSVHMAADTISADVVLLSGGRLAKARARAMTRCGRAAQLVTCETTGATKASEACVSLTSVLLLREGLAHAVGPPGGP
jgi:hypothetical protein